MFDSFKKNDLVFIASDRGGYDYNRVFFLRQTVDSITIFDFASNEEREIPKDYILEITKITTA